MPTYSTVGNLNLAGFTDQTRPAETADDLARRLASGQITTLPGSGYSSTGTVPQGVTQPTTIPVVSGTGQAPPPGSGTVTTYPALPINPTDRRPPPLSGPGVPIGPQDLGSSGVFSGGRPASATGSTPPYGQPPTYTRPTPQDANNPALAPTQFGALPTGPGRNTPQASAPTAYTPTTISGARVGSAPQVGRTVVGAAPSIQGTQVGQARDIEAERIAAAQIGPVERAMASTAEQTRVDRAASDQLRAIQMDELAGLQDIIAGRSGPSAAMLEQQRQTARNMAMQIGAARAGTSATSAGVAAKDMMDVQAAIGQDAALQQAILKAKEIEDARGALRGLAGDTRNTDVALAGEDARLANAVNLANASMGTDVSKANAQFGNTANIEQARLTQSADEANQRVALEADKANQATQQATIMEQARIDSENRRRQAEMQLQQLIAQANLDQQRGIVNAQLQSEIQRAQAQLDQATMEANQTAQNAALARQHEAETQTRLANLTAQTQANQMTSDEWQAVLNAQTQRERMNIDKEIAERAARAEEYKGKMGAAGAGLGALGGIAVGLAPLIAPAAASDRRAKKNFRRDDAGIEDFLEKLAAWEFEYTEPEKPGRAPGQRYGVMAQDVEQSAVGRSFVKEIEGTKMLDVGQALGPVLASLGVLNRKVEALSG